MCIPDARVIRPQSCDRDVSLSLVETSGTHWVRRQQPPQRNTPNDSQRTGEEVHIFPGLEGTFGLTQAVVDERRENGDVAGAAIPDARAC